MKRWYSIDVHARWSVPFLATPAQVADMRADGLVIDATGRTLPIRSCSCGCNCSAG